jgi:hypothetical protein
MTAKVVPEKDPACALKKRLSPVREAPRLRPGLGAVAVFFDYSTCAIVSLGSELEGASPRFMDAGEG